MNEFGINLKKARESKNYTQQMLADQLYVTRQAVSRWENGARLPDLQTTKNISSILDVSIDELLENQEVKKYCEESIIFIDHPYLKYQHLIYGIMVIVFLVYIILEHGIFSPYFKYIFNQQHQFVSTFKDILIWIHLVILLIMSLNKRLTYKKLGKLYISIIIMQLLGNIGHISLLSVLTSVNLWSLFYFSFRISVYTLCILALYATFIKTSIKSRFYVYSMILLYFISQISIIGKLILYHTSITRECLAFGYIAVLILLVYQTYIFFQKKNEESS